MLSHSHLYSCRDAISSRVTERILVASHTNTHNSHVLVFFSPSTLITYLACISTFVRTIYMILVFIPAIIWKQKADHKMEFLWYDVTIWHRQFNYSALKSTVIVVLICPDDWIVVRFGGFENGFNQCTIDHMWVLHLIYLYACNWVIFTETTLYTNTDAYKIHWMMFIAMIHRQN